MNNNFSPEENERESKRLYGILDQGVRERLMSYPGVQYVSVGLKITGDDLIWERCFHVYVEKKIAAEELPRANIVPAIIDGIKTDVHEIGEALAAMPVAKGGIKVSNSIEFGVGGREATTFGTIAAVGRDKSRSCNVVALTNWHVLYIAPFTSPVSKGTRIFQPQAYTVQNGMADVSPDPNTTDNDVGKVINGIHNGKVDCGVFEVNRSCCNCCGVDYYNIIEGLENISPLHFNGITGSARAHTGDTVFFVGASSGPSKGFVVTDAAPKRISYISLLVADRREVPASPTPQVTDRYVKNFTGQLKIRTDGNHPINASITRNGSTFSRFVEHGDSGSLLVNSQNKAVGLIFATDSEPGEPEADPIVNTPNPPGVPPLPAGSPAITLYGYANHYEDVIAALQGIGIQFEITYSQPATGGSSGESLTSFVEPDSEIFRDWKRRINAMPRTRAIADAVASHREEVMLLINHCRPVTVAWHRVKGPAFAAAIAGNIRDGKFEYPLSINGVTASQLLLRMHDVLQENGSSGLKEDLYRYRDIILEGIKGCTSFEDVMMNLAGEFVP